MDYQTRKPLTIKINRKHQKGNNFSKITMTFSQRKKSIIRKQTKLKQKLHIPRKQLYDKNTNSKTLKQNFSFIISHEKKNIQ